MTIYKCNYGCGNDAKHQNKSGTWMCDTSPNKCPEVRKKNSTGMREAYSSGDRQSAKERYANLPDEVKEKMKWNKGKYTANFSYDGIGNHKSVLITERGHQCEDCKNTEWLGKTIPLELEHSDGNNRNNIKTNLKLLCPNCHAFTPFYRGRNKNSGKLKVADEEIIKLIEEGLNNRQLLLAVGLAPKGGSYYRVDKLRLMLVEHAGVEKLVETQDT